MKKLTNLLILVAFLLTTNYYLLTTSEAAVPHLINYQGRLTDSSGTPLNGSYALTFRIYDAETAGNLLWQEAHAGVVIQKGIFGVLLGSIINLDLPFDKQYYLEIVVAGEVMSPRQRIASAAYAIRAERTEEIRGSENIFSGAGNVGIGTTNPASNLEIRSKGFHILRLSSSAEGANPWDIALGNKGLGMEGDLSIGYVGPVGGGIGGGPHYNVLTFQTNGNVGIGTNNPTEKLHIASGGIKFPDGSTQTSSVKKCQICYQKWADGDWGQCGPPYSSAETCAPVDSWTEAHRDDTDGRGGGCYQRWRIVCP